MRRTVRLRIRGLVQGVWYRGWTLEQARMLGLDGWVRNRRDGSVEAVLSGSPDAVERMIQCCWDGPPAARVQMIDISEEPATEPAVSGFVQRETI